MKFEKGNTVNGINIPPAALKLCGFGAHEGAEYHTLSDCVVVLKKRMSAPELVRAAWSLFSLSTDLVEALTRSCDGCDGECPYSEEDFAVEAAVPEEIRRIAGIPEDAVLHVEIPERHKITVCESTGDLPSLWDIPVPMMEGLLTAGVCPASLETLLRSGEVAYGDKNSGPMEGRCG